MKKSFILMVVVVLGALFLTACGPNGVASNGDAYASNGNVIASYGDGMVSGGNVAPIVSAGNAG